jgi:hypothetical protein
MSNELQGAITVLVGRIEQKAQEVAEMKRTVNSLCLAADQPILYSDADLVVKGSTALPSLDPDEFYGKPPTTAARLYLEKRNKAVPLDEILSALENGGFDFDNQNWPEDQRLRHLGSSMGKNSLIFHRLPNDTWGLLKWYPTVEKAKKRTTKANGKQISTADDSQAEEAGEQAAEEASEKTKTVNAE